MTDQEKRHVEDWFIEMLSEHYKPFVSIAYIMVSANRSTNSNKNFPSRYHCIHHN